ncbi:MAG: PKD domain-containing protein, partial [Pseudolysinimonas sp.]
ATVTGPHEWDMHESLAIDEAGELGLLSLASSSSHESAFAVEQLGETQQYPDGSPAYGCTVWKTSNFGADWSAITTFLGSACKVVTSGDGEHLLVLAPDNRGEHVTIYTSADGGGTWDDHVDAIEPGYFVDITMSNDGSKIVIMPGYPYEPVWISNNYGVDWHAVDLDPDHHNFLEFRSVAGSADGQLLLASEYYGRVYASSDAGETWATTANLGTQVGPEASLSTSATGEISLLGGSYRRFQTSTDFGQTWNNATANLLFTNPARTAISADGDIQVAVNGCNVVTSTDRGATWRQQTLTACTGYWDDVTISDDGTRLLLMASGKIYVGSLVDAPPPDDDGDTGDGGDPDGTVSDTYVALGDSYQSGEGTFGYNVGTDAIYNTCHRSGLAYPSILARTQESHLKFVFRACSGAKIQDMFAIGIHPDKVDGPSQLDALGPDTRLVTIGIGGNDLGFADIVNKCIVDANTEALAINPILLATVSCQHKLSAEVSVSLKSLKSLKLGSVRSQLTLLYHKIRERAPYARVIVVTYPKFFPANGSAPACSAIRPADQIWMNSVIAVADASIIDVARSAGFEYADMSHAFDGHEQCTASPAINGIVPDYVVVGHLTFTAVLPASESFHPNSYGHLLMATQVERTIGQPLLPTFTIHPGEQVSRSVVVSGTGFSINVGWPGSDVETSLISPSGVEYSRSNPQDATHGNGATYEYFEVPNPEPGEWTVHIYGADVADEGEPVTFSTFDEMPPNEAPTATVKVSGSSHTYTFDASASTDADGSISGYFWDFGDGTTSTGTVVKHTYTVPGSYLAALVATDDEGLQGFAVAPKTLVVPARSGSAAAGDETPAADVSVGSDGEGCIDATVKCSPDETGAATEAVDEGGASGPAPYWPIWLAVAVLVVIIGPSLYFALGRIRAKRPSRSAGSGR